MVAYTSLTNDYATILSTTLRSTSATIQDNISQDLVLLHWLKSKGRSKGYSSGHSIQKNVMLGLNPTVKSYTGYERGEAVPTEGITAAFYPWRQMRGFLMMSGLEQFQNGEGPTRIADALGAKLDQLIISFRNDLSRQLYGDGTGNNNKDILGLGSIIAIDPTNDDLGLIDSSVNTDWRNKYYDADAIANTDDLIAQFWKMYNDCSVGRDHPTVIITGQSTWENYALALRKQERYMNSESISDGFDGLLLRGAPMFFDRDMPDTLQTGANANEDGAYFINDKHIEYSYAKSKNFTPSGFKEDEVELDALKASITSYHNMCTDNRRMHGVVFNIARSLTISS